MPNPKLINFNNGEGLDYNDLNDMQIRMNYKLLDVPYYPNIIDKFGLAGYSPTNPSPSYNSLYNDPTIWLDRATFFVGSAACRLLNPSGLDIGIDAGSLVIYDSTAAPVFTQNNLVMFNVDDGDVSFTLDSNSGGGADRYDALVLTLGSDTIDDSQTRDFKDAVTGALSTQSVDKGRSKVPVFSVIKGTLGAGRPTIPANNHLLGFFVVDTGDTITLEDCMYPFFGEIHQIVLNPFINQGRFNTDFNDSAFSNFVLTANLTNSKAKLPIPIGGPFRILSCYLDYSVSTLTGVTGDLVTWEDGTENVGSGDRGNLETDLTLTSSRAEWVFDPLVDTTGFINPFTRGPAWWGAESAPSSTRFQANIGGRNRGINGVLWNLPSVSDSISMCSVALLKY